MPRRLALAALAALMLLPVACGGDEDAPPPAPTRDFGPEAAEGIVAVEQVRAQLVPVTDLVGVGDHDRAARHLAAARRRWERIEARVRAGDAVLAREVSVAFDRVSRAVERRGTFDTVRDVASPLAAQLLGGVREELVERDARADPGVNAAALVELLEGARRAYARGDRASLEHAFGLVDRSQAVAREIAGDLGPRRDAVIEGLKDLREAAFPEGIVLPEEPAPAAEVARRADEIAAALRERFRLG